jgi:kynureninase
VSIRGLFFAFIYLCRSLRPSAVCGLGVVELATRVRSDGNAISQLSSFHREFAKPENVYFAGNSLGLMPLAAESVVAKLIQEWKQHAIEGWTSCGWVDQAERLLAQLTPLMGARPDEIAVTGSTRLIFINC